MKHYLSFIQWLICRVFRAGIAGPSRLFAWYKQCLEDETFIAIMLSVGAWAVVLFAGVIASSTSVDGKLVVKPDDVWPFGISLFVPPVVFIVAVVSIQYDRYCWELERTMNTLKGKHDSI